MKIYLNECFQTLITIKNHAINSFIVIKRGEKCVAKVWNKNNENRAHCYLAIGSSLETSPWSEANFGKLIFILRVSFDILCCHFFEKTYSTSKNISRKENGGKSFHSEFQRNSTFLLNNKITNRKYFESQNNFHTFLRLLAANFPVFSRKQYNTQKRKLKRFIRPHLKLIVVWFSACEILLHKLSLLMIQRSTTRNWICKNYLLGHKTELNYEAENVSILEPETELRSEQYFGRWIFSAQLHNHFQAFSLRL